MEGQPAFLSTAAADSGASAALRLFRLSTGDEGSGMRGTRSAIRGMSRDEGSRLLSAIRGMRGHVFFRRLQGDEGSRLRSAITVPPDEDATPHGTGTGPPDEDATPHGTGTGPPDEGVTPCGTCTEPPDEDVTPWGRELTRKSCYTEFVRNMTIVLDEEVARWVRVRAAEQDTSVSRFVGELLREMMDDQLQYERAREAFSSVAPRKLRKKGESLPSRDVIHERRIR
jgi:plasmid stability protein